jgi:hypothetical protein
MNVMRNRWIWRGFGAVGLALLNACAVSGASVGGDVGVGYDTGYYGGGYYEPWGYEYGGWGDRYHMGPGRGGDRRAEHRDEQRDGRGSLSYRSAPASRPTPSIPNHPRGH